MPNVRSIIDSRLNQTDLSREELALGLLQCLLNKDDHLVDSLQQALDDLISGYDPVTKRYTDCDTRYAVGIAALYANEMAQIHDGDARDWILSCEAFVSDSIQWHEQNRWQFTFLEGFQEKISQKKEALKQG